VIRSQTPARRHRTKRVTGTIGLRQIAPGSTRAQDPKDTVQDAPVANAGNATRLVRKEGPDGSPFKVSQFVPHDSRLRFGGLNHVRFYTTKTQSGPSRKRRFYELLRNESIRRQVQPLMFVAVEGLVGALVEAQCARVARFSRGGPGCGERVVRSRSAIDRKAIMNRTCAVTVAATAIFATLMFPQKRHSSSRPRKPWSVWILHENEEVYYAVV
jgi:hypothetical protein